jgi:hypothetical protein
VKRVGVLGLRALPAIRTYMQQTNQIMQTRRRRRRRRRRREYVAYASINFNCPGRAKDFAKTRSGRKATPQFDTAASLSPPSRSGLMTKVGRSWFRHH